LIEVIGADELLTEAVEEVSGLVDDKQYSYEYDILHLMCVARVEKSLTILQLYQPLETSHGTFVCRICLELGETVEFENKTSYTHHRYKVHGSYNNNHICPVPHCREIYASMTVLRKHLCIDHKMPIEMHFRTFANVGEFERFRHLVETLCNCRFMMHTKQPHNRRQIMHCSKSEHKTILQSRRHKLPQVRMMKEGAWCPAQISFRTDPKTGRVDAFYQLFHYGHAKEYRNHNSEDYMENPMVFPEPPKHYADRPLQYVKIDLVAADSCVYLSTVYSLILIITDIKTGFIFSKPIPDTGVRPLLIRIVTDIFLQFGVPGIFIHYYYSFFLRSLYDQAALELQSKNRWVEMVQFTAMVLNQSGSRSPFKFLFFFQLRNFESTASRGNALPYLYGSIGETDWENSPRFPYRVYFSKNKHPWPSEENIWASPYDVLPTTHDLLVISPEVTSNLLCCCGGGDYGVSCSLFRSYLCANGMAKACCLSSGKPCGYHEECCDGDDSYNVGSNTSSVRFAFLARSPFVYVRYVLVTIFILLLPL
uniref:C2H2-type domain-containing protein n=1 Tax=Angiostrongylus cantonensis TaxID=6313 RepID=A0A0K0DGS1_ANGCA